jgi:glycosyltransferase involved in cell wall biosynthesis
MEEEAHISIIIPTFNRASIIGITLDSILAQTYANWECIVVDDGSTDATEELLQKYMLDDRFQFIKNNRSKGAPGARNTGLLKATGEFIFFFDSDNSMEPNTLQVLADEIREHRVDVCVCYANVVNEDGKKVSEFTWNSFGDISEKLISGETYVDYNIALIRKTAIDAIGLTDEDCPSFQEWDTHLRLSQQCTYHTEKEFLINYLKGETGTISSDKNKAVEGYYYILNKHQEIFKKYPEAFKNQGLELIATAKIAENPELMAEVKEKLNDLIPGFKKHLLRTQLKSTKAGITGRLKSILKKK